MSLFQDLFGALAIPKSVADKLIKNEADLRREQMQIQAQMQIAQIQAQRNMQHQQYAAQQQSTSRAWSTVSTSLGGIWDQQLVERDFRMVQSQDDLDHAVFKTPVEDLVNMWLAKYGSDWVNKQDVLNDEFYEWAAMRLRAVGRLEEHTIWQAPEAGMALTAQARKTVLRIVDK